MNNDTMTDDMAYALGLYTGGPYTMHRVDDNSGDLFSDMEEVIEELKSLRLHSAYNMLIKKAMVRVATERLITYDAWVNDTQVDFDTWDQEGEQMI